MRRCMGLMKSDLLGAPVILNGTESVPLAAKNLSVERFLELQRLYDKCIFGHFSKER